MKITTPLCEVIRTYWGDILYSVLLLYRCGSCCHKGFAKSFEQNRNIEFAKTETCCMMGEWIIYAIHKNISALAPLMPSEASNLTSRKIWLDDGMSYGPKSNKANNICHHNRICWYSSSAYSSEALGKLGYIMCMMCSFSNIDVVQYIQIMRRVLSPRRHKISWHKCCEYITSAGWSLWSKLIL